MMSKMEKHLQEKKKVTRGLESKKKIQKVETFNKELH